MSKENEPEGLPLTLGEARGVAQQIRQAVGIDRQYWPWVIEQLVARVEAAEARAKEQEALLDQYSCS